MISTSLSHLTPFLTLFPVTLLLPLPQSGLLISVSKSYPFLNFFLAPSENHSLSEMQVLLS